MPDEFTQDELEIPDIKYEYLDHTADVQLHAWGETLEEAFEQCAMAMYAYMTEIETVEITDVQEIEAEGDDMLSLLFHFLDECLFLFCAEPYLIARVHEVTQYHHFMACSLPALQNSFQIKISQAIPRKFKKVKIQEFDKEKFSIKAKCYGEEFQLGKHPQGTEVKAITYSNMQVHQNEGKAEVFVIIDI